MNYKRLSVAFLLMVTVFGCNRSTIESVPDFNSFPAGTPRKEAFINYLSPIVLQINNEIRKERRRAIELEKKGALTMAQHAWLRRLAKKYRFKEFNLDNPDWNALLKRVDTIPPSLVVAQSANESAWGTSRFARQGNNLFGQWCFKAGCGIVPENRWSGKKHEVALFESPTDSVRSYIMNLNTHWAYRQIRALRETLRNDRKPLTGISLADGLTRYSERGQNYVEELKVMIRYNRLDELDHS